MSLTAINSSTHHPRKQNPKVKTGCKTCKYEDALVVVLKIKLPTYARKRRIKYDELRPHCLKCTSAGRKYNGYSQTKHAYQTGIISYALESPSNPKRALSPLSKRDNVHQLAFYVHCIGPMLSGRFDTDFWCGIVLQMAYAESAVRNAMMSLTHLTQQQTHASRSNTIETGKSNQKFLVHYNKTISCLVSRMTDVSYASETGLVTCLLFACVEFLR